MALLAGRCNLSIAHLQVLVASYYADLRSGNRMHKPHFLQHHLYLPYRPPKDTITLDDAHVYASWTVHSRRGLQDRSMPDCALQARTAQQATLSSRLMQAISA